MPKAIFIIALVLTFASQAAAQSYERVTVPNGRFEPKYLAMDADNRLYAADEYYDRVLTLVPNITVG